MLTYLEIAAFIASLLALKTIWRTPALRIFPLLLGLVAIVETYEEFFANNTSPVNVNVYNIQVPLQHLLYLVIIYFSLGNKRYRKYILFFIITFIVAAIALTLFASVNNRFNAKVYCVGAIYIVCSIVLKFYDMLQNPADFNFLRNPFFYMLFAYLLFLVGTLPYFTMSNWLYFVKGYKTTVQMLVYVSTVLNIILYSTYTIAFLWMTRKKDFYLSVQP
ncbi:hypothetical protein DXN05_13005 [Deminuibacter soli]|uniref:Uncharacterized protein n=2 Tax=Deminuibacter soli TaxID=2291815 RepID=A0A3E1NI69_9BACT|nr:hypothetical protein DXN05_13005 [Deminuibacter soli]